MSTLTLVDLKSWLAGRLPTPLPMIAPGPAGDPDQVDSTPGPMALLTRAGGPGLELEGLFDRVMWTVDCAGEQNDPDSAEALALAVDLAFIGIDHSQYLALDGVRVLCFARAGGGPAVSYIDNARRWHYSCSYVVRVESGI